MQLIINADDFGLTSGVNRGILDCHLAGTVTSTTLMVTMPAAGEAAELARVHPALGVGLHFNLTLGPPAAPAEAVPSLVDRQGQFHPRSMAEKLAMGGGFRPAEIECELLAQLRCFEKLGLTPTHLDSHQHIHAFPVVFDVVAAFCSGRGLPLRVPWAGGQKGGIRRRFRAWVLDRLLRRNAARWAGRVTMNAGFGSVFDRVSRPGEITLETYRQILRGTAATPFELMVHPALVDDDLRAMTRIAGISEREYALLSDCRFVGLIRELGYRLVNYRQTM